MIICNSRSEICGSECGKNISRSENRGSECGKIIFRSYKHHIYRKEISCLDGENYLLINACMACIILYQSVSLSNRYKMIDKVLYIR